ncbi:MAG TPA: hypothetical protein VEJ63_05740 [Planctomycetota bacterium]|nr:hypothetical protein [Planctomycetota bacterium]
MTKGLGTPEKARAELITAGLVALWTRGIRSASDTPIDVPLESARLFFGQERGAVVDATTVEDPLAAIRQQIKEYPPKVQKQLVPVLMERDRLYRDNESLRLEVAALKKAVQEQASEKASLERSILGRAVVASKNMPPIPDALVEFEKHMLAETSRFNTKVVLAVAKRFVASLPSERKYLVDVTAEDVMKFLDAETTKGSEHKRAARRDAIRRRVGRLLNWSAGNRYPSQMLDVEAVKKADIHRERGAIHWHELAEVEKVIDGLPSDYWRTLVSSLAYAGLQLAELVWLRVSDVHIAADGKSGHFTVTTVSDPEDPRAKHLLKTEHRKREVNLHPTLLKRIVKHLKSDAGKTYLFPMPKDMQLGTRRITNGSAERWLVNTLSQVLRGHPGGAKRNPVPGLLPKGMNAKSLRRTFGSLLLRSGKSSAEVAAAMGNTELVVRAHYAKLKGAEVKVDF